MRDSEKYITKHDCMTMKL